MYTAHEKIAARRVQSDPDATHVARLMAKCVLDDEEKPTGVGINFRLRIAQDKDRRAAEAKA